MDNLVGPRYDVTMMVPFGLSAVSFLFLFLTVLTCWFSPKKIGLFFWIISALVAFATGVLQIVGLLGVFAAAFCLWLSVRPNPVWLRSLSALAFITFAILISTHQWPGFQNLMIFAGIRFSPQSSPYTLFLNFDKVSVGILIYLLFLKDTNRSLVRRDQLKITALIWLVLLLTLLPLALMSQYVSFDPKWPVGAWLWALNNLFFVVFAEEAMFRGFIQGGLSRFLPRGGLWQFVPLTIAALLFGLAHFKGGMVYVALATVAGLFYGYAYKRTQSLESAMLVHFGLNAVHFFLYSYPVLAAKSL